jgi:hypothetical protein
MLTIAMKCLAIAALSTSLFGSSAFAFAPKCPAKAHINVADVELGLARSDETSDRRTFMTASGISIMLASAFGLSRPALAAFGADAKMEFPDVMQGISDRTNKQCLVESLGNRDCLVYLDPDNQLYKGSDGKILFERLAASVSAMKNIPSYIESKQWSKVDSTLTGKMGNLSLTMNELAKLVEDDSVKDKCKSLSVDIRNDLYAIAGSCSRKQQAEALKSYDKALLKLEKFVALVNGP